MTPSKVVGDLQIEDKKVTLNHLVVVFYISCIIPFVRAPCLIKLLGSGGTPFCSYV